MLLKNCSDRDVDMVFVEEVAGFVLLARYGGRGTPLIFRVHVSVALTCTSQG